MTEVKFIDLWRDAVVPSATLITKKNPQKLKFNFGALKAVEFQYENNREKIHALMKDPEEKIDRHKVASALTYAIIKICPFSTDFHAGDMRLMLGNELLAMASGLKVMAAFIRSNPETPQAKKEIFKFNKLHQGLRIDEKASYVEYLCRSLTRMRIHGLSPDDEHLMLLSHPNFFMERAQDLSRHQIHEKTRFAYTEENLPSQIGGIAGRDAIVRESCI